MEQKFKLEFPLDLEIKYEDAAELLELAEQEEFITFMFKNAIAAVKQAIRKNKSECVIYSIQNYNVTVAIKKEHYKTFLNKALKHYEKLEDYSKCSELVTLKSRL
jgi:2-phospho-L-lactate guanylyltransferase (CobY/MobA/RfbA family)